MKRRALLGLIVAMTLVAPGLIGCGTLRPVKKVVGTAVKAPFKIINKILPP